MYILDTNILIRYLTNDTPEQTKRIEKLFIHAKDKSLIIPDVILIEIVYVLLSYYELNRRHVIEKITAIITFEKFKINTLLIQKTLEIFEINPISFVDAYLLALTITNDNTLYTFDKKLLSVSQKRAIEP